MKDLRLKFAIYLFVICGGIASSASSCEKGDKEDCIDPKQACSTKGTIRSNICGVGLWGGYVIELDNGEVVQPWAASTEVIQNFRPKTNQRIQLSFTAMERDERYDNIFTCLAIGEYAQRVSKFVKIDCIKEASNN